MSTTLNSLDNLISQATSKGMWQRSYFSGNPATTTAATTNSGYVTVKRYPNPIIVPTMGAGITGMYLTSCNMCSPLSASFDSCNLEYSLGTVTANGGTGTFVDGSVMPTKTIRGTSIATATQLAFAYVSTVMVGAGTYTLTITYTNQDGVGSRTATLTIPNVAIVNSAFLINPHLQAGDTGIQDVTGITLTGTTGVVTIMGCLVLAKNANGLNSSGGVHLPPLISQEEMWLCETGENITFYSFGAVTASGFIAFLAGVPSD